MESRPLASSASPPTRGLGRIAWERRGAACLGGLIGVALGMAYWMLMPPAFNTSAQVLVVKKRPDAVTGADPRAWGADDYVATHLALFRSPLIIERAIVLGKLSDMPTLAGAKDSTEAVLQRLSVNRIKDATGGGNVVSLAYRSKTSAEGAATLKALIDVYREVVEETFSTTSESAVDLIAKARDVLQKELAEKENAYRDFRRQAPLIWKGKDGVNPRQERLEKIDAQRTLLLLRHAELQSKVLALEDGLKSRQNRETMLAMVMDFSTSKDIDVAWKGQTLKWQEQVLGLLLEEQKLLQKFGPNHPEVKTLHDQLETARDFLNRPSAPWGGKNGKHVDPVDWHIQALKQELKHLTNAEKILGNLHKDEQEEARKQSGFEVQDDQMRNDIARTQQLFDTLVKRLRDAAMVKDYGGFDALVIAAPGSSGVRQVQPSLMVAGCLSLLLALLGAAGLAWSRETWDKRLRSAEDVRRWLELPVLGQTPLGAGKSPAAKPGAANPLLFTMQAATTQAGEAFRSLRTAFLCRINDDAVKVVQIASPNPGEGKSVVAANLAVALAQSGRRVLLVDADMHASHLHQWFNLRKEPGLSEILNGQSRWTEVVQSGGVSGLEIIPAGDSALNPADLLSSAALKKLLAEAKEQYDLVLIDSPALLAVSDASVIAAQADGVLLVVRQGRSTRPQAEQAAEILAHGSASLLGVVLNGVDFKSVLPGYLGIG